MNGCADAESSESRMDATVRGSETVDYCEVPATSSNVIAVRPSADDPPIDDVNWFARPVPHSGSDRILAFASHDQNELYNITTGARIRIPDRSDAVATPDGRYMTVPSTYTPDSNIRFYPIAEMLERLAAGEDADDIEPVFIHEHAAMKRVYYQSTGIVSRVGVGATEVTTYRLMLSGTSDESKFRIVDYRFTHDSATEELLSVEPSAPMALCPTVTNDLNTPFISKDAQYVAAYTSEHAESSYTPGASLKIFRITSIDPERGTTSCAPVVDLGFTAGKADFSFDGSMLTFHVSQGGYLTPFVNGGLEPGTITDVVVARLDRDEAGLIRGVHGVQRLTTSLEAGVGSYFPAFFPDGSLFYIANSVPKDSDAQKRFHFRVLDPDQGVWRDREILGDDVRPQWRTIASMWEKACFAENPELAAQPFPMDAHEAPWLGLSLSAGQCHALVDETREASGSNVTSETIDWAALGRACESLGS